MTAPLLETRDLRCVFQISMGLMQRKQNLHAVNGVNLTLRKGESLGLVGESGCGKTTLARILLGLQIPTKGSVQIEGQPIIQLSQRAIARRIQPVFQDPYSSLNPRKTLGDIIALPLRVHGIGNRREINAKVHAMMDMVGLPGRYFDRFPGQLSGGQRQRVAIARALVMRPEVVICDEPTSALDVSVQAQILNLLLDLQKELGLTYLLISHDLAVVEHMTDRVSVMYLGRIVEEAPTEILFHSPKHPYTRALLDSVLTPDPQLGIPDTQLGLAYPNPLNPPTGCAFHPRCPSRMTQCPEIVPEPVASGETPIVECLLYAEDGSHHPPRPESVRD